MAAFSNSNPNPHDMAQRIAESVMQSPGLKMIVYSYPRARTWELALKLGKKSEDIGCAIVYLGLYGNFLDPSLIHFMGKEDGMDDKITIDWKSKTELFTRDEDFLEKVIVGHPNLRTIICPAEVGMDVIAVAVSVRRASKLRDAGAPPINLVVLSQDTDNIDSAVYKAFSAVYEGEEGKSTAVSVMTADDCFSDDD